MTDVWPVLHTGAHAGLWGTVEVLFAVFVLVVSVALVVALLGKARTGTPEAWLAAAFGGDGQLDRRGPSDRDGGRPLGRRGE